MLTTKKEEPFVQVWDYILDNEELDLTDVILLSKVISLHKTKDGCYMTNGYVCTMLRLKNDETASRRISKLQKLGYIELRHVPLPGNKKKTRRYIIPTYEKGLSQKSTRTDLKVNKTLTTKSSTLDLKVNDPLILKSTTPCLESQSITSVDNINENISLVHQCNNISSIKLTDFEKEQVLLVLDTITAPDRVLNLVRMLVTDGIGYLTSKNKDLILQHKHYFNKGKVLQQIIQQLE